MNLPMTADTRIRRHRNPPPSRASPRLRQLERTIPFVYGTETADVGTDLYTAVTEDYARGDNTFTGTIRKVDVKVGGRQRHGAERSCRGLT